MFRFLMYLNALKDVIHDMTHILSPPSSGITQPGELTAYSVKLVYRICFEVSSCLMDYKCYITE